MEDKWYALAGTGKATCGKEDIDAMTHSGLEIGARVRLADDVQDAGRCGSVVGNETFVGQWWCPVLWDDVDDPEFHKSGCLELLGEMEPEDWQELLHTLTKEIQRITPGSPGEMRQDRIMAIVGKIGSGDTDKLDVAELDEIRRSLTLDAETSVDGGVHLRTISGKIGPGSGRPGCKAGGPLQGCQCGWCVWCGRVSGCVEEATTMRGGQHLCGGCADIDGDD